MDNRSKAKRRPWPRGRERWSWVAPLRWPLGVRPEDGHHCRAHSRGVRL